MSFARSRRRCRAAADARPRPLPQMDPPHPREAANAAAAGPRKGAPRRDAEGAREAADFKAEKWGDFWLSRCTRRNRPELRGHGGVVLTLASPPSPPGLAFVTSSPRASPPTATAISRGSCGGCTRRRSSLCGACGSARSRSARRSSTRRSSTAPRSSTRGSSSSGAGIRTSRTTSTSSRKLLWEYLHPLNDGWAFALSLQAVLVRRPSPPRSPPCSITSSTRTRGSRCARPSSRSR